MKPPMQIPSDYVGTIDKSVRLEVIDGALRTYRRRWMRPDQLVEEVTLDEVRHIHWYTSPFSRVGTVRVTLWDRPATFELFFDITPVDIGARQVGEFRAPDLRMNPSAHEAFVAFFRPLVVDGSVSSAVDLRTLCPLQPSGEPAPASSEPSHT